MSGSVRGWEDAFIGDIRRDDSAVVDPRSHRDEEFDLYSVPACPTGKPEVVLGQAVGSHKQSVEPGTVLVCKINPRINRVWVVGQNRGARQIASTEWIPLFPIPGIDPHFLAYQLRRDHFRNYLAANVSGVGGSLMRVRPSVLDRYRVRVAPIAEQKRTVQAIDSQLSRLDEGVVILERVQRNLKRYQVSMLKAAVEGRLVLTEAELARAEGRAYEAAPELLQRILAEHCRSWERLKPRGRYSRPVAPELNGLPELPEGWCWATADQLAIGGRPIIYGIIKPGPDTPGGVPYVRVMEMKTGSIDVHSLKRCHPDRASKFVRATLRGGDLLISKDGTIGKVAVVPPALEGGNITQHVLRMSPAREVNPRYLVRAIESDFCQRWMAGETRGVALQGVNVQDFRRMPIPLPPLSEQARISETVEDLLSVALVSEHAAGVAGLRLARLRQSILKWAFEGKLVNQDPTDEPASVLLERIKAEGTIAVPVAKPGAKKPRTKVSR